MIALSDTLKPDLFTVQISRTKVDYIDTKDLNPEMSLGFYLDFLTGDKSTIRNVFGISISLTFFYQSCKDMIVVD